MAVTRRYTNQIVILTEEAIADLVEDFSDRYGVAVAQVSRDCIELGLPALAEKYRAAGLSELPAAQIKAAKAKRARARKEREARKSNPKREAKVRVGSARGARLETPAGVLFSESAQG